MRVRFTEEAAAFLDLAGRHLAADPVTSSVVATVAERLAAEADAGLPPAPDRPRWFATLLDEKDRVVGAAMRTAPFDPYPAYCLPMPDEAAWALADALLDRDEVVPAVNGALPAARILAESMAARTGGTARVALHTRLFELHDLVSARPVPGRLRPATPDDVDLCLAWFRAFEVEAHGDRSGTGAAEDPAGAGQEDGEGAEEPGWMTAEDMLRRIRSGLLVLHEADGEVVHLTGFNPPAMGAARIGPVYTPPEHRGRGYASAAVAEVSRRLLAEGVRPCLFTDQANPVSNRIYLALGYRPVVDMVELEVTGPS